MNQDESKALDSIRLEIMAKITEYNLLAAKCDAGMRVGLAESSYDGGDEGKTPGCSVEAPEADSWFSSSYCY